MWNPRFKGPWSSVSGKNRTPKILGLSQEEQENLAYHQLLGKFTHAASTTINGTRNSRCKSRRTAYPSLPSVQGKMHMQNLEFQKGDNKVRIRSCNFYLGCRGLYLWCTCVRSMKHARPPFQTLIFKYTYTLPVLARSQRTSCFHILMMRRLSPLILGKLPCANHLSKQLKYSEVHSPVWILLQIKMYLITKCPQRSRCL